MTTGITETAQRVSAENPEALEGEYHNIGTKVANMLDADPETARCMSMLGGMVGGLATLDLLGGGLEAMAGADVMSAGNASLSGDLNMDSFGGAPNVTAQFTPDGNAAPVATPSPTTAAPTTTVAAAGPSTMPGLSPTGIG